MSKYIYTKFLEHLDNTKITIELDSEPFEEDDDYIFLAYYGKDNVGSLRMEVLYDAYEYEFKGDISEDEYNRMFSDETVVKIEYLKVEKEFRNNDIANKLMIFGMKYIKEQGYNQFYLNASPQYDSSLQLPNLITFYEKFGFKVFLHQGNNALMHYDENDMNESKKKIGGKPPMTNGYQYSKMLKQKGYVVVDGAYHLEILLRGDGEELDRAYDVVIPDYSDVLKQNRIDRKNGDTTELLKVSDFDLYDTVILGHNDFTGETREIFYSEIEDILLDLNVHTRRKSTIHSNGRY